MPRFKICTSSTWTFATLIHSNQKIVVNLQPRNQPTRDTICSFDVRTCGAKWSNIQSKTTSIFAFSSFLPCAIKNTINTIIKCIQITTTQLRSCGAAIEKSWSGRSIQKLTKKIIILDCPFFFVFFIKSKSHGNSHPKTLWSLHDFSIFTNKISVGKNLNAKILETIISANANCFRKYAQIILKHALIELATFYQLFDVLNKAFAILQSKSITINTFFKYFFIYCVEQKASSSITIIWLLLYLFARTQYKCCIYFLGGDFVVQLKLCIKYNLTHGYI